MPAPRKTLGGEQNTKLLIGWKQIANYLGMGVRTVQRHERLNGLPIRRPAGHSKSAVIATIAELDAWVAASPIRDSFMLASQASKDAVMESLRNGMAKMGVLRDEMRQLRQEFRDSVKTLHSSIRVVGVGRTLTYPDEEGPYIDSERKPERKNALDVRPLDNTRKPI